MRGRVNVSKIQGFGKKMWESGKTLCDKDLPKGHFDKLVQTGHILLEESKAKAKDDSKKEEPKESEEIEFPAKTKNRK